MEDYNYIVTAELRRDLTDKERENALAFITEWQGKYAIRKIDEVTYCAAKPIKGHDDFGAVTFFYGMLKRRKKMFSRLEYFDRGEGETDVAVITRSRNSP